MRIENRTSIDTQLVECAVRWALYVAVWRVRPKSMQLCRGVWPISYMMIAQHTAYAYQNGSRELSGVIYIPYEICPTPPLTKQDVFGLICAIAYAKRNPTIVYEITKPTDHRTPTGKPMDMYRVPEATAFLKLHKRLQKDWGVKWSA